MIDSLWRRIRIIAAVTATVAIAHIINVASGGQLDQFGILPRSVPHWYHVFTAPFVHGDWVHLINNLIGLSIFSAFCLIRPVRFFIGASVFIIAVGGGLVWLFARDAWHIGASGWVFGLWSVSIAMAWFDRKFSSMLIAVVVVFLYGGMIYGILPNRPGISFEAHLFGAIAGVLWAFLYTRFDDEDSEEKDPPVTSFD